MKKFLLLLLVIGTYTGVSAQTATEAVAPASVLEFKEATYNFGKIPFGRPVTHEFEITNKGKEAIRIEDVQASCGCTTPEWSRDPIAPGATSTIKVGYNAAAEGAFSKTVTVFYNGQQQKTIVISGTVYQGPATSAPLNSSISLLKKINR
jgi:hypothetical protein